MTSDSSQWHGASIHSHLMPTEPFVSSGPYPPQYWDSALDFQALLALNMIQEGIDPDPSSFTLPTEYSTSAYSCDSSVGEPSSNACHYGYQSYPGGDQYLLHPLGFETNLSSVDQSIPESALAIPAQKPFCQPPASSGLPSSSATESSQWYNTRTAYPPPPEPDQASAQATLSLAQNGRSHDRRNRTSATIRRKKHFTSRIKSARLRTKTKKGSRPNPLIGATNNELEDILSRLSAKEQYVVEERLKGTDWDDIRKGYKWKELKSKSYPLEVLKRLRKKHDIIGKILPSRQGPLSRTPKRSRNTRGARK